MYGQYKAGMGNILNVLTTQATLSNTRSQLIQAKLNWYVALSELNAALGNISISDNITNNFSSIPGSIKFAFAKMRST